MFKLVEKGLSREDFISKKQDIESNLEGETYWGQKENEETAELWYTENYSENGDVTYDIYE